MDLRQTDEWDKLWIIGGKNKSAIEIDSSTVDYAKVALIQYETTMLWLATLSVAERLDTTTVNKVNISIDLHLFLTTGVGTLTEAELDVWQFNILLSIQVGSNDFKGDE
jgi:hypothetical protein